MMEKLSLKTVIVACLLLIAIVVGSYAIGIGVVGGGLLSFEPSSWHGFASYFNNMLSPFLAAIAAAIAFFSLSHQLKEARKESSLNEQISNYLNHLNLLQKMIDKRWRTIKKFSKIDWEEEPYSTISYDYLRESILEPANLSSEVTTLCRLFEDLADGIQWYTHLHKEKIEHSKNDFPRNEWSHFSKSLIQEQDKKMKFCYEYCLWQLEAKISETSSYHKEFLIFRQFYENLLADGTLNGQ